jgi:type I restriction enzyme S subunit
MFDDERITWSIDGGGKFFHRPSHQYSVTNVCGWLKVVQPDKLITKYIYYVLISAWGGRTYNYTVKAHPSVIREDYLIPLPPMEVQREIVRILDTFTELEEELEAELESRYLQMQHYARAMTEIFSKNELTTLSLAEFAEIGTGSRNTQDAIEGAEYPFYVRSQSPLSIDRYEFDEQAVLTAGDGVGVGKVFHFANGKYALHQRAYRVKPDDSVVDPKFLFYFMKNNFGLYLDSTAVHASVTSLRRPMFEKFEVTFPSLESQRKIVHFLDLLEAYIGDQNGGIHAELHARRKQFEYYRNKLLTFKALEAS